MQIFIYQEKVMCYSYNPTIAPRKNSVGRLFKYLLIEETFIVDALLQQSMLKGFDFTSLSKRNQI